MMKKIISGLLVLMATSAGAQIHTHVIGDSIYMHSNSGTAEMILENSTKNVDGFLYNKGNGRTEFRRGAVKLNDSTYIIGADTLRIKIPGSSGGSGMAIGSVIGGSPNNKSVLFVGTGGRLSQNSNLIFDSTNKYLGINMASVAPSDFLQVGGATGSIQFGGANGRTITARNATNDGYSNFDFIANSVSFDAKLEVLSISGTSGRIQLYEGTAGSTTDGSLEHVSDNLNFTAGTTRYVIPKTLVGSATLDFPSTTSTTVSDLTITVTGAAVGDGVALAVPNGSTTATGTFSAWVSATDTVKIRFSPKATENPASGTFKVSVIKY